MAVTILLGLCLAICMITDIIKRTVDIRVLILFFLYAYDLWIY